MWRRWWQCWHADIDRGCPCAALRQLSRQTVGRFIFRELAVGAVNGMVFAITAGVISWLWFGNIDIAIIMGFAMIANLIIAGLSGTLIPLDGTHGG